MNLFGNQESSYDYYWNEDILGIFWAGWDIDIDIDMDMISYFANRYR